MNSHKIKTYILVLGLYIALNSLSSVQAQVADFAVTPSRIDLMIKPNKKVIMSFKVTNYGDPATFTPRVMNAVADSEEGNLTFSKSFKTPATFTFQNDRREIGEPVFLKTNETISIPVTLETGGGEQKDYYYYFVTEMQPRANHEGKTAAQLQPRIGAPIILTLTNIAERELKGSIAVFRVKPDYSFNLFGREFNLVETGSAVPVYLSVSNTGSNFITPTGKISVKSQFGPMAEHPVLPRNIYAQSPRLILTKSSYERYCPEKDNCRRFSLLLNGFLIGKYDLAASMNLGGDSSKSFKSVSFIAFPFKPVAASIFFLAIYVLFRHHKNGRRKK